MRVFRRSVSVSTSRVQRESRCNHQMPVCMRFYWEHVWLKGHVLSQHGKAGVKWCYDALEVFTVDLRDKKLHLTRLTRLRIHMLYWLINYSADDHHRQSALNNFLMLINCFFNIIAISQFTCFQRVCFCCFFLIYIKIRCEFLRSHSLRRIFYN